jgi:hypothetical protein
MRETRIALKLDVLNKKLDKELVGALQESEFEKEQLRLRRAESWEKLPVHNALSINSNESSFIMRKIDEFLHTIFQKDYDGKTAFEMCLEKETYHNAVYR